MKLTRLQGWEQRFDALFAHYLRAPFVWGENDCLIAVADVIECLSGFHPMTKWIKKYSNEEEANLLLKTYADGSLEPVFEGLFPVYNLNFAARADVGIATFDGREFCGFVGPNGRDFFIRHVDGGLKAYPIPRIRNLRLWRVE